MVLPLTAAQVGSRPFSSHCAYLSLAKLWLDRSRRRRLSLSIRGPGLNQTRDYMSFLMVEGYMQRCTTLDVHIMISISQCLHLFRHAFVLTEATFSNVYPCDEYRLPHGLLSIVELENLHTLHVTSLIPIELLLDWLFLPQLRSLGIEQRNTGYAAWPAFAALLDRSGCQLKKFVYTTDHNYGVDPTVQEFLKRPRMQNVRSLALRGISISNQVVEVLKASPLREHILPQLEQLELGMCVGHDGGLAEMVTSRSTSPPNQSGSAAAHNGALRSISVTFESHRHEEDISQLTALSEHGLQVEIRRWPE
ncbi:hypothetical protein B0H10DRAFT_1950397 [Mycena sp. CBHHK59/15]|nr:hypothetical protein B0H10DRAFT_1950397 [Mycena sp. CBHHK59/15]